MTIVKIRESLKLRNKECEDLKKWNEKIKQELYANIQEFEEFSNSKKEYE